jgi:hypothetical protein
MARTIGDVDGSEPVVEKYVLEAINYRSLDHKLWKR